MHEDAILVQASAVGTGSHELHGVDGLLGQRKPSPRPVAVGTGSLVNDALHTSDSHGDQLVGRHQCLPIVTGVSTERQTRQDPTTLCGHTVCRRDGRERP